MNEYNENRNWDWKIQYTVTDSAYQSGQTKVAIMKREIKK